MYNREPGLIPVEDFTQEDRERALELLLSQERVVTLLYSKTFPVSNKTRHGVLEGSIMENSGNGEESALLLDMDNRPSTTGILGDEKLPSLAARPDTGA